MTTTKTETTTETATIRETFNETVFKILNGDLQDKCYMGFIELCVFYQKMNEHNTTVLKRLSNAVADSPKYDYVEEVNETLNGLLWDRADEQLSGFMTTFANL